MAATSAANRGTTACLSAFIQVQGALSCAEADLKAQLSSSALEDELGRLRVWAANIGALQKGHSSLDYRLRESPLVQENVLKLLNELQSALIEIHHILSGTRLPYELESRPESDDDGSDSSSSIGAASENSLDSNLGSKVLPELQQRLYSITDIIDNLFKMSRSIRAPSLQERYLKGELYKKIDQETGIDLIREFANLDLAYTAEIFRQMRRENDQLQLFSEKDNELIKRFASAITRRRQQFLYWKRHRDKLGMQFNSYDFKAGRSSAQRVEADTVKAPEQPVHDPVAPATNLGSELREGLKSIASRTALTATTATAFIHVDNNSNNEQSITSFATTARGLDGNRVELPGLPKVVNLKKDFECPYCFTICPAKYQSSRAWRVHLLRDLRPYVCTYLDCDQPGQMFGSKLQWLEHERLKHRRVWQCPEHPSDCFTTLHDFEVHIKKNEHQVLSKMRMAEVTAISDVYDPDPRRVCAVCLGTFPSADDLHKHLAYHLERFSAFSLPRDVDTDDDNLSETVSGQSSIRADARSYESSHRERFVPSTVQDLLFQIGLAIEATKPLVIPPDPVATMLAKFEKKHSGHGMVILNIREMLRGLKEGVLKRGVEDYGEECVILMQQIQGTLGRLLESCKQSTEEDWGQFSAELDTEISALSQMAILLKETPSIVPIVSPNNPSIDPALKEFLISGPRERESEKLLTEDQVAKDDFIFQVTGTGSIGGNLADCCLWYIQFLDSKIRVTWSLLFQPIISGLSNDSSEPGPGDLAIAYTLLGRVARQLQNSRRPLSIKNILDDESIATLWNLRHPKAFWTLIFCSIGWLTLLYEPGVDPEPGVLHLANKSHTSVSVNTIWNQINLPITSLLVDIQINLSMKPSRKPKYGSQLNPTELWKKLFKEDVNMIWTDMLDLHLKLDESTGTVHLFRFPSFCRAMNRVASNLQSVIISNDRSSVGFLDSVQRAIFGNSDDVPPTSYRVCEEIIASYCLIFGQYFNDEEHFDSKSWHWRETSLLEVQVGDNRDPMIQKLCRRSNIDAAKVFYAGVGLHYDTKFQPKDFPLLWDRLIALQEMNQQEDLHDLASDSSATSSR